MNFYLKVVLYIILVGGTALFTYLGYQASQTAFEQKDVFDNDLVIGPGETEKVESTDTESTNQTNQTNIETEPVNESGAPTGSASISKTSGKSQSKMISHFLLAALFLIGSAVLIGRDIAGSVADKTINAVLNTEGALNSEEYERAEGEINQGNYLEGIEMLRAYFKGNPTDVFAARRIAEIYEKDLQNYQAAAEEYEFLLTLPLPAVRWGWTGIHLCNLYTGKLNNSERALEILQDIVVKHIDTAPGKKAKATLEKLGYQIELVDEDDGSNNASRPGFKPKT